MEIRQLKYFLAVADQRSFVNAANVLFLSRQAISKAISQLEEEMQVELFMRESNGAFLTPAGVLFYDRVRGVVREFEQIQQEMREYGSRYHQRLRLAFSVGTLPLFEQRLQHFSQTQRNADVDYSEYPHMQCRSLILEHQVDAVVSEQRMDDPTLESAILVRSRMGLLLCAEHPLAELEEIPLPALSDVALAVHSESEWQPGVEIRYTGYDYSRLVRLTEEGRCVLLLPRLLAQRMQKELLWRPVEGAPRWSVYITRQKTPSGGALADTLLDELQRQVLDGLSEE